MLGLSIIHEPGIADIMRQEDQLNTDLDEILMEVVEQLQDQATELRLHQRDAMDLKEILNGISNGRMPPHLMKEIIALIVSLSFSNEAQLIHAWPHGFYTDHEEAIEATIAEARL